MRAIAFRVLSPGSHGRTAVPLARPVEVAEVVRAARWPQEEEVVVMRRAFDMQLVSASPDPDP